MFKLSVTNRFSTDSWWWGAWIIQAGTPISFGGTALGVWSFPFPFVFSFPFFLHFLLSCFLLFFFFFFLSFFRYFFCYSSLFILLFLSLFLSFFISHFLSTLVSYLFIHLFISDFLSHFLFLFYSFEFIKFSFFFSSSLTLATDGLNCHFKCLSFHMPIYPLVRPRQNVTNVSNSRCLEFKIVACQLIFSISSLVDAGGVKI